MSTNKHIELIARKLGLHDWQVENTIRLMDDGATIPFISRYRKEMTGSLDEVQLLHIKNEYDRLKDLDARREAIIKSVEEQEKMTPELMQKITAAETMAELEDIYLPYRPKRRTRATVAREKGLEPLAEIIFKQQESDPSHKAEEFLNDDVQTAEDALSGACDIIAEWINEEEEGFLKLSIEPIEDNALDILDSLFVKGKNESSELVGNAVRDGWKRLLSSSMESEFRNLSKEKADEEAIRVFADNLRQLLLSSPLGEKNVLAIDPGFRTGCKIVCLDR